MINANLKSLQKITIITVTSYEILIVAEWDKGVGLNDFRNLRSADRSVALQGFVLRDILTKKWEHYKITCVYKMSESVIRSEDSLEGRCF